MEHNITMTRDYYYNNVIKHLIELSEQICKDNNCTDDEHFCESNAYFDWKDDHYELIDVCISDYRTKCDDSYIPLPIPEDYTINNLIQDLENNDIREF